MIRVALVDDHQMVRDALAQILADSDDVEVVGVAADSTGARELVSSQRPDVVVLDYALADGPSLPLIEEWGREPDAPGVVVLTVHDSPHYAVRALEAGALGFVVKASAFRELLDGVRACRRGEVFVSPSLSSQVMAHLRAPRRERVGLGALSTREFELLRLLATGVGLQEAARVQNISPSTASTYRSRMLEKLGLRTTGELIRFAIEHGIA